MKPREARLIFDGPEGEVVVDVWLEFTCPFCHHRRKVAIGNINGDDLKPVGVHETPHCEEFERLDLVAYMRSARLMGARPVEEPS